MQINKYDNSSADPCHVRSKQSNTQKNTLQCSITSPRT